MNALFVRTEGTSLIIVLLAKNNTGQIVNKKVSERVIFLVTTNKILNEKFYSVSKLINCGSRKM